MERYSTASPPPVTIPYLNVVNLLLHTSNNTRLSKSEGGGGSKAFGFVPLSETLSGFRESPTAFALLQEKVGGVDELVESFSKSFVENVDVLDIFWTVRKTMEVEVGRRRRRKIGGEEEDKDEEGGERENAAAETKRMEGRGGVRESKSREEIQREARKVEKVSG